MATVGAQDASGNVVAGIGGVAADAAGNVSADGVVGAAAADTSTPSDASKKS